MAAFLRRPPLAQRVPSPAACSQLPGAELHLDPLPYARGTHGCGEDLSQASRVDFLPTSSHFLMSALSLRYGEIHCWRFGCHGSWSSIHRGKMNPGVWFDGWGYTNSIPQMITISPLGTLSFGLSTLPPRNPTCQCKQFSGRVWIPSSNEAWYQPQRRDCQTSPT